MRELERYEINHRKHIQIHSYNITIIVIALFIVNYNTFIEGRYRKRLELGNLEQTLEHVWDTRSCELILNYKLC